MYVSRYVLGEIVKFYNVLLNFTVIHRLFLQYNVHFTRAGWQIGC